MALGRSEARALGYTMHDVRVSPLTMQKQLYPQYEISLHACGELKLRAEYLIVVDKIIWGRGTPIVYTALRFRNYWVGLLSDGGRIVSVGYGQALNKDWSRRNRIVREMMPSAVPPHPRSDDLACPDTATYRQRAFHGPIMIEFV
jgi:hypothetical protein